ncbi:MAG: ABC transporter ATP-binding protein [Omnitrophica WOR_2 bacterium]|jgi:phospholipid/cholesterol/gamma-HCH transport system ATP-binding protein
MIEAKDVTKIFGGTKVLDSVSVKFETGKCNLVIGQSGSGKTVLMKCLVGLFQIDEGNVTFDDKVLSRMSFDEMKLVRQDIGMLFQGGALFDSMNVEQNVMFPLSMFTQQTLEEQRDRANFCLSRVNLVNVNKLLPAELSGGMKKRVAIARAIAMKPRYLFCDEPNSGLDPHTANVIDNLIKEITDEYKMTTVVNTHDMNSVIEIGDNVCFIFEGKLWWEGNKETILTSDNKELNDFVFATQLTRKIKNL